MAKILIHFILILIIIVLLDKIYRNELFTSRKKICNNIDGRCYPIVDSFSKQTHKLASETLAYLNEFSIKILRNMREKYLWNNKNPYRKRMIEKLLENYNPDSIIENNPTNDVNTSYVEDKGKVFAICLREKKTGQFFIHDYNILEFVLLHEMAHLSTDVIGHDDVEFWTNFKILIDEAIELKLHDPINYEKYPINYCSLEVDYNPYFDTKIPMY